MADEQSQIDPPAMLETGAARPRIAYRFRPGTAAGDGRPTVAWLGGFKSDMLATKASFLDQWARENGRAFLRFDYSGHGESEGLFEHGTIGRWLAESLAVIRADAPGPLAVVPGVAEAFAPTLTWTEVAAGGEPRAGVAGCSSWAQTG